MFNLKIKNMFLPTLLAILLLMSLDIIIKDPIINYDDHLLLTPIESITTIQEYMQKIQQNEILDIQPIRDLSYWIDFQIEHFTHIKMHHFTNVIIWGILISIFYLILIELKTPEPLLYYFTALLTFHPCMANSIYWISARKHLLSAMFITIATLFTIRRKSRTVTIFSYIFSIFSHPINLLWPCWHFAYTWKIAKRKYLVTNLILFSILTFSALINLNYYSQKYIASSGFKKILDGEKNEFSYKILAIGRSFWQIFIPTTPMPTPYYQGSLQNIMGIAVFVLFIWISIKKQKSKWIIFITSPLIVIYYKMTNIFGSDTYIIITLTGALIICSQITRPSKLIHIVLGFFTLLYSFKFYEMANYWKSEISLFTYAYQNERTPGNTKSLTRTFIKNHKYREAFELSNELIKFDPTGVDTDYLYCLSLNGISISTTDKITFLESAHHIVPTSLWISLSLINQYLLIHQYSKALMIAKSLEGTKMLNYHYDFNNAFSSLYKKLKIEKNEYCKEISLSLKKVNLSLTKQGP